MGTRIAIIALIIGLFTAGVLWAKYMVEENVVLKASVDSLVLANAAEVEERNFLVNDIRAKNAQAVVHEQHIKTLNTKTKRTLRKLADAKRRLRADEVSCMESNMPKPYTGQLRERTRTYTTQDRQDMPGPGAISAEPIRRF